MSDEKRQTRLLPFRLRRAGATLRGAEPDGAEDFSADAELTALLHAWEAPPHETDARARLLADFRASVPRAPLWRRALAAELRVPLPVAACAALALFASLFALGARGWARTTPAEVKTTAAPEVKFVEVPVVQERVVTRTVYVEKKEPDASRGVNTRPAGREELAGASSGRRVGTRQRVEPARAPDDHAGYFTRVNMEDFQPADEMKIRIVSRGGTDEK